MGPELAEAQDAGGSPPAAPTAPQSSTPPAAAETPPAAGQVEQPQANRFTREELRKLLAPIALYPDALLAQLLPASAYPLEIVQAHRWLDKNRALVAKNDFSGIDKQKWDPAVKAMARFPDVLLKMSEDLPWTTDLSDAIVNQPQDVADVIQELRSEAEKSGALKTTPEQTVKTVVSSTPQGERTAIVIQPTDPSTLHVPTYDPNAVYYGASSVVAPLLTFGTGVALGWGRWRLARTGTGARERSMGPDMAGVRAELSTLATSTSATMSISATAIGSGVQTVTIVQGKAARPELAIGPAALEAVAAPAGSEGPAGSEALAVPEVLGASGGPAAWED